MIFEIKIILPNVVNLKNAVEGENTSAGGWPVRFDGVHEDALLVNSVRDREAKRPNFEIFENNSTEVLLVAGSSNRAQIADNIILITLTKQLVPLSYLETRWFRSELVRHSETVADSYCLPNCSRRYFDLLLGTNGVHDDASHRAFWQRSALATSCFLSVVLLAQDQCVGFRCGAHARGLYPGYHLCFQT